MAYYLGCPTICCISHASNNSTSNVIFQTTKQWIKTLYWYSDLAEWRYAFDKDKEDDDPAK